jgi:PqqD family protein of HPr-rel-A system
MTLDVSRLHELALSDSGFVFDPLTGHTFTVNSTGLFVLQALKQGVLPQDIPRVLEEQFELDGGEDLGVDVSEFLGSLGSVGLVR